MGNKNSGLPDVALLSLDGTAISHDGKKSANEFFRFLRLPAEHTANLEKVMTPAQAVSFRNHILQMKMSTASIIPKLCGGPRCHVSSCLFHKEKNWPLLESCPVELTLIITWFNEYVEDLDIDIDSKTEMVLVNKLVELDILDYRANIGFSTDEEAMKLIKYDRTTNGNNETEIMNVHPLIDIKERLHKMRMKILESLNATRQEKVKKSGILGKDADKSIGDYMNQLKTTLKDLKKDKAITVKELREELAAND